MSAPNPPADWKALISTPSSSMCSNFVNTLLKLPVLIYNFMKWLLDDSGNITKAAINQLQPPGSLEFAACVLPEDGTRLLCDGRSVSQTTYADLYAAIGTTYGTATAGLFKLPDWRAMALVGLGSGKDTNGLTGTFNVGVVYGEFKHTQTKDEAALPDHTHPVAMRGDMLGGGTNTNAFCPHADGGLSSATDSQGADATNPMNVVQPSLGAYVYIRT